MGAGRELLGATMVAFVSCTSADVVIRCPDAALVQAQGHPHCVYGARAVAEAGASFRCPGAVPSRVELGDGSVVCTDRHVAPCALPDEVCDLIAGGCCPLPDAGPPSDAGGEPDGEPDPVDAAAPPDTSPEDAGACTETVVLSGDGPLVDSMFRQPADICAGPETNHGRSASLGVCHYPWACFWRTHGALRADLGGIPADARVLAATLRLYLVTECSVSSGQPDNCGSFAGTWDIDFLSLRRRWEEEQILWSGPTPGESWAEGGGLDPLEDHFAEPEERLTLFAGEQERFVEVDLTASVQLFVSGERDNHGWLLRGPYLPRPQSRCADFASTQSEMTVRQPSLTITYEAPCR